MTSHNRGHPIYYNKEAKEWRYVDDDSSADVERPCRRCGEWPNKHGHDYCLADLGDKVVAACCGHCHDSEAYILLKDGRRFVLDRDWGGENE